MSALERVFFPLPELHRDPVSLFLWWEHRRPLYNVLVGATGLVTLGIVQLFAWMPPHPARLTIPWIAVAVYAGLANVCYSSGLLAELLLQRFRGDEPALVGPALFRQGLIFSLGLTALPSILAVGSWGIRIMIWIRDLTAN